MRSTTYIYALICPLDNQVKYIGKSNDPQRRARDHMSDWRGAEYKKLLWLRNLKSRGLKPILELIEEVSLEMWKYWETFWIAYYRYIGASLLNVESGGQGLTVGNHQTFKKRVICQRTR